MGQSQGTLRQGTAGLKRCGSHKRTRKPLAALACLLALPGDQGERHALSHVRHACAATPPGMACGGQLGMTCGRRGGQDSWSDVQLLVAINVCLVVLGGWAKGLLVDPLEPGGGAHNSLWTNTYEARARRARPLLHIRAGGAVLPMIAPAAHQRPRQPLGHYADSARRAARVGTPACTPEGCRASQRAVTSRCRLEATGILLGQ